MSSVTDQLIEQVAVLICYSGFHGDRDDTPESYWATVGEQPKAMYRREARHWIAAWRSGDWKLVPAAATGDMAYTATQARAGIRSLVSAHRVWRDMVAKAPSWLPGGFENSMKLARTEAHDETAR